MLQHFAALLVLQIYYYEIITLNILKLFLLLLILEGDKINSVKECLHSKGRLLGIVPDYSVL